MRKTLFLILFYSLNAFSQNFADKNYYLVDSLILEDISENDKNLIDTCLFLYHIAKNDTIRVNIINEIVSSCWDNNVWPKYNYWVYNFSFNKLNYKLPVQSKIFYQKALASSLNNIGYLYNAQGDSEKAIENYLKSLQIKIEIRNQDGIANALNNIGNVYRQHGNIKKALEYFHQSLKIREDIGNESGIANSLNNIGVIYKNLGDYKKALKYFSRSLKLKEIVNNEDGIANTLNNIGSIYQIQDSIELALTYFNRSLKIYTDLGHNDGIAFSLSKVADINYKQNNFKKALSQYNKSLKIYTEINNKNGIALSLNNIGEILFKEKQFIQSKKQFNLAYLIGSDFGYPERIEKSSFYLSRIAEKENNFRQAFYMYSLHVKMRDSLNNNENQKEAIQQETKYKYEKQKALDNVVNEKIIAIEKAEKQKQKIIIYSIGVGLILVVGFLIFIFNRLQITKKQNQVIQLQKQRVEIAHSETERKKKEIELQKSIIEETHKEITDSINYAKRLQSAILPSISEVREQLKSFFILFKPKDVVSGDFYWFEHKGDTSFIAAADCTGHGVPGALVSVVCSNALNRSVNEFNLRSPSEILNKTRELVIKTFAKSGEKVKDGMDIALCAIKKDSLVFSGANNPLWIVRKTDLLTSEQLNHKNTCVDENYSLIEFKANKQPIGLYTNMIPFTETNVKLLIGDTLYLFTDGYADQFGGTKGKKLKYRPFKKLLIQMSKHSMENQKIEISKHFNGWKGSFEQIDDVCIIGIRFLD